MIKDYNEITNHLISKDTDWIDSQGKEFKLKEINNEYLFNICEFLSNGGGWFFFLTLSRVDKIFEEALRRFSKDPIKIEKIKKYRNTAILTLNFMGKLD
jgi:hypothetical protein